MLNMAKIDKAFADAGVMMPHRVLDYREPRVWVALLVVASKERSAIDWLKLAGVPAYWPNYTRQVPCGSGARNGRGARRAVQCAVIPGYLFMAAKPEATDPWDVVHHTPGIHGYLRSASGQPATMGETDIEIIRRIEGGQNLPPASSAVHSFKVGQKVRFSDDLLSQWPVGKIVRLADDGRIVVEVGLLGRTVLITAYPHQIEIV